MANEENEKIEKSEKKKSSCCVSDLRIFGIAFLTAIIMIALYHLGLSYCRMHCRAKAPRPAPQMLVCVDAQSPQFGGPQGCCCCRMMMRNQQFPGKRFDHHRMRGDGKHPMPGKGFRRPPMKERKAPEAPNAQDAPKAPAPDPKAPEAPKAPAPAPAK